MSCDKIEEIESLLDDMIRDIEMLQEEVSELQEQRQNLNMAEDECDG